MTFISDPDNEFEKQGVTFKIIAEEMYPQVNFYPNDHFWLWQELKEWKTPSVCLLLQ